MKSVWLSLVVAAILLANAFPSEAPAEPCPRGSADAKYAGSKTCMPCHFKEHSSWSKLPKSKAFSILMPGERAEAKTKAGLDPKKDYTKDPKCVACHTTGYGKPGGYPELIEGKEWTPDEKARASLMENVGCESCHGPQELAVPVKRKNNEYKWAEIEKLGPVKPVDAVCAACHNKDSPTYKPIHAGHEFFPMKHKHE